MIISYSEIYKQLPEDVQMQISSSFLFGDFYEKYKRLFKLLEEAMRKEHLEIQLKKAPLIQNFRFNFNLNKAGEERRH